MEFDSVMELGDEKPPGIKRGIHDKWDFDNNIIMAIKPVCGDAVVIPIILRVICGFRPGKHEDMVDVL